MDGKDAAYLKETVGEPLKMALTSMVVAQPVDAIEYIGSFLLNYVEKEEGKAARKERFTYLDEACAAQEAAAAQAAAEAEAEAKARGPTEEELALEASLETDSEIEPLYAALLKAVKRATGATSAYAAKKGTNTEGQTTIAFWSATEGCNMAGKFFAGAAPDAEEPVEGVTLDLFKQREEYEAEVAAADEEVAAATAKVDEAQAGGEEAPPLEEAELAKAAVEAKRAAILQYPAKVFVENVAREPRMKFFGVPLIGSYLALPVRFESALHAEGVGELKPVEEPAATEDPPPAADEPAAAEAGENEGYGGDEPAAETGAEAGGEEPAAASATEGDGDGEGAEPVVAAAEVAPPREPKNLPVMQSQEYIIALHTMGQSVVLTAEQMGKAEAWAAKLKAAHERADAAKWTKSALLREDAALDAAHLATVAEEAEATEEAGLTEKLAALDAAEEPPSDGDRALAEAKLRVAAARAVARVHLPVLAKLGEDAIPPPAPVVKVLMAALALAGVDPAGFAALGTGAPEWTLVAAKVTETLVEALAAETDDAAAFEADASAAAALPVPVATARALVEDLDEGAYASFYAAPSIAKVLKWAQTLFALYDAVKADVDAKAEAAAAAKAEED